MQAIDRDGGRRNSQKTGVSATNKNAAASQIRDSMLAELILLSTQRCVADAKKIKEIL